VVVLFLFFLLSLLLRALLLGFLLLGGVCLGVVLLLGVLRIRRSGNTKEGCERQSTEQFPHTSSSAISGSDVKCNPGWKELPDGESTSSVGQLDRKSTRLNSSHVSISYAVF